jgi:hypothetical protein
MREEERAVEAQPVPDRPQSGTEVCLAPTADWVLSMQRSAGNRAVSRLLRQRGIGVTSPASVMVQRFKAKRASSLFNKWDGTKELAMDAPFFPVQVKKDNRYFTPESLAKLRESQDVSGLEANMVDARDPVVLLADDATLAIVTPKFGESKTFFATAERIQEGNLALRGPIKLRATGRSLVYRVDGTKLLEVEPEVEAHGATGVKVRTPQNCNEMAGCVSGFKDDVQDMWAPAPAVLDIAGGVPALRHFYDDVTELRRLRDLHEGAFTSRWWDESPLSQRWGEVPELAESALFDALFEAILNDPPMREHVQAELNKAFDVNPSLGTAIGVWGMASQALAKEHERATGSSPFGYHFATIVAGGATDYVTLENYARRDPDVGTRTAGRGDPLFFFRMYSTAKPDQTFHAVQKRSGDFIGLTVTKDLLAEHHAELKRERDRQAELERLRIESEAGEQDRERQRERQLELDARRRALDEAEERRAAAIRLQYWF